MYKRVLKELNFEKADLFYYKMDPEYKSDLDNLISKCSSIFGEKKVVSPIHNKGDITGYMMQKNAQNFAELAEVIYKFASQNNLDGAKEFTCYQIQEAAKLGTQGSIHRIYERDREMAKALAMSNAATLITPEMKEDLKIYKANNLITNYKHRRLFKPSNYGNRRLNWPALTSSPSTYQSGFTDDQNASQPFFLNEGESLGQTLSPK
ncbi:MAG: hypothetical protein LBQ59_03260 [Candidatus Peribacteria bacterium]|jgi:hypothetical protein|nr:hypothetical protein [Candidatus Peribacteria bacterium]